MSSRLKRTDRVRQMLTGGESTRLAEVIGADLTPNKF